MIKRIDLTEESIFPPKFQKMYYFAHLSNLSRIISNGILSRNSISRIGFTYKSDFSNSGVQTRRHFKEIYINETKSNYYLHDFVPLYWVPHTPTLYAVNDIQSSLFFIKIDESITKTEKLILYNNGNASSENTKFFDDYSVAKKHIPWEVLRNKFWNSFEDGKRKKCSEILIFENVEPKYFNNIIVYDRYAFEYAKKILNDLNLSDLKKGFTLDHDPACFF